MIELMVAVTISLVLMFGVGQIYLGSKASYRVRDDLTMMQETGRFAMETLTSALMMADHYGGAGRRRHFRQSKRRNGQWRRL